MKGFLSFVITILLILAIGGGIYYWYTGEVPEIPKFPDKESTQNSESKPLGPSDIFDDFEKPNNGNSGSNNESSGGNNESSGGNNESSGGNNESSGESTGDSEDTDTPSAPVLKELTVPANASSLTQSGMVMQRGAALHIVGDSDRPEMRFTCEITGTLYEQNSANFKIGVLLAPQSYFDEVNKFRSSWKNLPYMFKDPDEVNSVQFSFIQDYVNNMEASLYDDTRFASREYAGYIDIDSFIDYWFVQDLTGNEESKHPKSTYMHKDAGGKLTMGPVWDFDWETFTPINRFRNIENIYYGRLFQDPVFKARAKERWNMLKGKFAEIPEFIDAEAEKIRKSESMNHVLWPVTSNINKDISLSFDAAVEKMKTSYIDKMNWMDQTIANW